MRAKKNRVSFAILLILEQISPTHAFAQLSSLNYYSASPNPATLYVRSERHIALSPFQISASATSTHVSRSTKNLFTSGSRFLRENVLGTSGSSTGSVALKIRGPYATFRVTSKLTLSAYTRAVIHGNFWKVDGRLVGEIGEIVKEKFNYPYQINKANMRMTTTLYSELGIAMSHLIFARNGQKLRLGVASKVLNGISAASIEVLSLNGKILLSNDKVGFLTEASGVVETKTAGNLFHNGSLATILTPHRLSVGTDLGVEYTVEFTNKSKLFFLASLTDIGKIRYALNSNLSKTYSVSIPEGQGLFFNENFSNSSFTETSKVFDAHPNFFQELAKNEGEIKIRLPTSFNLSAECDFANGFIGTISINKATTASGKVSNLYNPSRVTTAVGWQDKYQKFRIVAPLSDIEFSGIKQGLIVNAGNFYFESSSVISNLFKSANQIDFLIGYHSQF